MSLYNPYKSEKIDEIHQEIDKILDNYNKGALPKDLIDFAEQIDELIKYLNEYWSWYRRKGYNDAKDEWDDLENILNDKRIETLNKEIEFYEKIIDSKSLKIKDLGKQYLDKNVNPLSERKKLFQKENDYSGCIKFFIYFIATFIIGSLFIYLTGG